MALPTDNLDFAWDRPESAATLRAKLKDAAEDERLRLAAWLMREARVEEVWQFLTLQEVDCFFSKIAPILGRRREVWEYLLRTARELGRL